MGCSCECVAKVFLVLLNILIGLIGFTLLAVGIFVQFAGEYVNMALKILAEELKKQGLDQVDLTNMYKELLPIINGIAIPLIVIGAFLFILSLFGCCGVCCNKRVCLLIFSIMVTIIFVGMLAGILYIIIGAAQIKAKSKEGVQAEIKKNYVGINSTNGISLVMNVLMIQFKCCGMDNYKDFENCEKWERKIKLTAGVIVIDGTLLIPIACCKMKGQFPSVEAEDKTCALTGLNSNKDTGCFKKIEEYISQYLVWFYVLLASPLVFMLVLMALGWYLWKKAGETSGLGSAAKMI